MYITLLGQEFIVISTEEIAHELLEKRSSIYSDRPYMLTNELYAYGHSNQQFTTNISQLWPGV